mgnify:CR=1 FL=1
MTNSMFCLIPVFPLIGVLLNGLLGIKYFSKKIIHTIAVGSIGLSFLFSVISFFNIAGSSEPYIIKTLFTWIPANLVILGGTAAA